MDLSSKPNKTISNLSPKITRIVSGQDTVVRDDQTRHLKFPLPQKMVSYDLDFLGHEKFCLGS